MRNKILLIPLFFICYSCITDHITSTVFIIKNNTNNLVKIDVQIMDESSSYIKDSLLVINEFSEVENSFIKDGEDSMALSPFGLNPNTAEIIFDDTLSIFYTWDDTNPRNIIDINNYTGGKVKDGLFEFTFTITEEDYNNAVLIEE